MRYRQLGRTGIGLSVVGFGCGRQAQLMIGDDDELRMEAIRVALAGGINYFDTADSYGGGRADTNLARAFRELNVRPMIVSKVTLEPEDLDDPRAAVLRRFDGCLERLERDHVEVLMLHNQVFDHVDDGERGPVGAKLSLGHVFGANGVAAALAEIRAARAAKAIAFTAFGGDIRAITELIDSAEFGAFNVTFSLFNPSATLAVPPDFARRDFARIMEYGVERGLGVMAIAVLAHGALDAAASHEGRDRRIVSAALRYDDSLPSAAIRYVLSKPTASSAVLGFSNPDHVRTALTAVDKGVMPAEAIHDIEAAVGSIGSLDAP